MKDKPMADLLADAINRRAAVEAALYDMASGKKPLPDAETCRAMARKLGVPSALDEGNPILGPQLPLSAAQAVERYCARFGVSLTTEQKQGLRNMILDREIDAYQRGRNATREEGAKREPAE